MQGGDTGSPVHNRTKILTPRKGMNAIFSFHNHPNTIRDTMICLLISL